MKDKTEKRPALPAETAAEPMANHKPKLDADSILTAEFEYIQHTAFQATEDRARVASYYLVTVGSLVAGLLTAQFQSQALFLSFAALFLILALFGLLTVLQLARLRQSWYESVRAMNQIKEYYLQHTPELSGAFAWRSATLPNRYKPWSVGFMLALQVAALGAGALAAAVVFAGASFRFSVNLPAGIAFVVYFILQITIYRRLLVR